MKNDKYVNLNRPDIKRAVSYIISNEIELELKNKDIHFYHKKHQLMIGKELFMCYDSYLHHPDEKDHIYAIWEYLTTVDTLIKLPKIKHQLSKLISKQKQ